jgi:hypothetical protein
VAGMRLLCESSELRVQSLGKYRGRRIVNSDLSSGCVAQRRSAGLISPRMLVRIQPSPMVGIQGSSNRQDARL